MRRTYALDRHTYLSWRYLRMLVLSYPQLLLPDLRKVFGSASEILGMRGTRHL